MLEESRAFAGKYVPERVLGQGGMGVVFEARHARLGQRVAIKVLSQALREHEELVKRFEREARAASLLSSAHAVKVFDIDVTDDGTPFIVMELLTGRDLGDLVEREGAQPVGRAVRWLLEACEAIAEAHGLGIVHRDLKPSNLFLAEGDGKTSIKVLDFGIAKRAAANEAAITHAVAPLGTPQYMSPEQVRCAKDVDARTDIWSLGVTLYELVTGKTPFAHDEASACIASIAADPVPDPRALREDLPEDFVRALMRALEKDPSKRYASVGDLVAALAPFAERAFDPETSAIVRRVRATEAGVDSLATAAAPSRRARRPALVLATVAVMGLAAVALPKCVGERAAAAPPPAAASLAAAPIAAPAAPTVLGRAGDRPAPTPRVEAKDATSSKAHDATPDLPAEPRPAAPSHAASSHAASSHAAATPKHAAAELRAHLPPRAPKVVVAASRAPTTEGHRTSSSPAARDGRAPAATASQGNLRVHGGLTTPGF
jgi:serine/threonine-protein kinase